MLSLWAESRANYHALTADKDLPTTKRDERRKVSDSERRAAKKSRQAHDKEWYEALSSPKVFANFLGMPEIFGEVEKPPEKTPEQIVEDGYAAAFRAMKGIFGSAEAEETA